MNSFFNHLCDFPPFLIEAFAFVMFSKVRAQSPEFNCSPKGVPSHVGTSHIHNVQLVLEFGPVKAWPCES